MSHGAAPFAARCVPRENRRATLRIVGIRRTALDQLHQFLRDGAAAETRGAGTVEHDEEATLETAREVARDLARIEEQRRGFLARQRSEFLVLQARAALLGFEPAREQRQAHGNEHRKRDDEPQPARQTAAQDRVVLVRAHRVPMGAALLLGNRPNAPVVAPTLRNAGWRKCAPRHDCDCTVFRRTCFWPIAPQPVVPHATRRAGEFRQTCSDKRHAHRAARLRASPLQPSPPALPDMPRANR